MTDAMTKHRYAVEKLLNKEYANPKPQPKPLRLTYELIRNPRYPPPKPYENWITENIYLLKLSTKNKFGDNHTQKVTHRNILKYHPTKAYKLRDLWIGESLEMLNGVYTRIK